MDITFRKLTNDDLGLMHEWLNDPGVVRWWEGDDVSWEGVVRDYGQPPREPIEHWLVHLDGRAIGWIQCFAAADFADEDEARHWFDTGVDRTAAGIDYLVGPPDLRGRGVGSAMIRAFVSQIVFGRHPAWTQACASPMSANVGSVRALAKAGFRRIGTFHNADGEATVMVVDRPADLA